MYLKLQDLLQIETIILKLINYSFDTMIKNKIIVEFYKKVKSECEFYHLERQKLFNLYGEKLQDKIKIKNEFINTYNEKINELLNMNIDDDFKIEISENDIYNADFCGDNIQQKLTPKDIILLSDFIENNK